MRYEFKPVDRCNMCGSNEFTMIGMRLSATQGFSPAKVEGIAVPVKHCAGCGLNFADPQPVPEKLSDHYGLPPETYWQKDAMWNWSPDYFATEIAEAKSLLGFNPKLKALDIGVGLGKAMHSLNVAGFDTWGIEPSPAFREKAIAMSGLDPDRVTCATVEEAEFPDNHFDFITFGAVLEHIYDPSNALKRTMRWLKPGGILHAEVPSSDHLIQKIINAYFRFRGTNYVTNISPMHPPYHLYEFTLRSFRDFDVALHRHMVCSIYHLPKIFHPLLRWWMERTKTGMQLVVYLRKP